MKKVGYSETQLGRETNHCCCGAKGARVMEKEKTQAITQGSTRGKEIFIAIDLESVTA